MTPKVRTWIYPLLLLGFLITVTVGCKKDETNPDFAKAVSGTYTGTVTMAGVGSVAAVCTIAKATETTVNMTVVIGGSSVPLPGITVTGSSGSYNLSYSDSSGSFTGTVVGKTLNWTLTADSDVAVFTGTR